LPRGCPADVTLPVGGREPEGLFQELRKSGRVATIMKHQHDDFRQSQFGAIRTKLGKVLREQYDLTEPPPQSLVELLRQLDARVTRETTEARLYAAVDECVAAIVDTGNRPGA
jgi:hypothetical protein